MPNIIFNAKQEQSELIEGFIQSGDFATKDEVLNAALKSLAGKEAAKLQRLRHLIDEGINSGEAVVVDKEKLLREIKSENV